MHARSLARPVPRHASYPGTDRFSPDFGYRDYLQAVAGLRTRGSARPLSLSLHMKPGDKAAVYLGYLKREIEMQGRLFAGMNQVEQLHFGGAVAQLSEGQTAQLMLHLRRCFQFVPDAAGEYAVEVDLCGLTRERVLGLRRQGLNRISLSCAAEHIEPFATRSIVDAARDAGFGAVGVELACDGDLTVLAQALARVAGARPDRIGVPATFLLNMPILADAGYVDIGMGQFVLPGDALAVAQMQGRLHRNLHGYSAHPEMDLVACGAGAISAVANTYSQNVLAQEAYYDLIDKNELPVWRGIRLTMDDAVRRTIMQMLMCQFELSIPCIEQAYPIVFADYFGAELEQLRTLEREGLVTLETEWINVTAKGRMRVSSVCMAFERYPATSAAWTA
ncbi:MAG: coproporphyrinogen III oxidase [Pseudomonadota bacterium]